VATRGRTNQTGLTFAMPARARISPNDPEIVQLVWSSSSHSSSKSRSKRRAAPSIKMTIRSANEPALAVEPSAA
jgi:hypothetical protein